MLRIHTSRKGVVAIARVRPSMTEPTLTTLVIARSGDAATAPRPAADTCPHSAEVVAKSEGGTCPASGGLPPLDESTDEGKKKKRTSITMLTEQLAQPVAAGTDDG